FRCLREQPDLNRRRIGGVRLDPQQHGVSFDVLRRSENRAQLRDRRPNLRMGSFAHVTNAKRPIRSRTATPTAGSPGCQPFCHWQQRLRSDAPSRLTRCDGRPSRHRRTCQGILYTVTDTVRAAELDAILASIFMTPEGKADPYPGYAT